MWLPAVLSSCLVIRPYTMSPLFHCLRLGVEFFMFLNNAMATVALLMLQTGRVIGQLGSSFRVSRVCAQFTSGLLFWVRSKVQRASKLIPWC